MGHETRLPEGLFPGPYSFRTPEHLHTPRKKNRSIRQIDEHIGRQPPFGGAAQFV